MGHNKFKVLFFYFFTILILTFNFYSNSWNIIDNQNFESFESFDEAFIIGRLALSDKESIFSNAGFPGVCFEKKDIDKVEELDKLSFLDRNDIVSETLNKQLGYYTSSNELSDDYFPYLSQSGGQGIFYSLLNEILPINNSVKFKLFRLINAFLCALCFTLLIGWARRNFGVLCAVFLLLFISISPFIIHFSSRLWWSLWSFYIPFLGLLLLLERKYMHDNISENKMFMFVFLFAFIKYIFTGFEFSTSVVFSVLCPIVYYCYMRREKISTFIILSFKSLCVTVAGFMLGLMILFIQLRVYIGSWEGSFSYIIDSYTRRTEVLGFSFWRIFKSYLKGDAFNINLLNGYDINVFFIGVLFIILCSSIFILYKTKDNTDVSKYRALIISFFVSLISPISWFFLFKEHSYWHPHLDFIVWYIPTLLIGFMIVGIAIQQISLLLRGIIGTGKLRNANK